MLYNTTEAIKCAILQQMEPKLSPFLLLPLALLMSLEILKRLHPICQNQKDDILEIFDQLPGEKNQCIESVKEKVSSQQS